MYYMDVYDYIVYIYIVWCTMICLCTVVYLTEWVVEGYTAYIYSTWYVL